MITIILICVIAILTYIVFNLLRKIEKLSDIVNEQDLRYINVQNNIIEIINSMRAIDSKEAFEKDDEVGSIFSALVDLVESLGKTNVE